MTTLNVRMTDEEYDKIKRDAIKCGFLDSQGRPQITAYIKFLCNNVKIEKPE